MNDWRLIKKSVTPLNVMLLSSVLASLIYIALYLAQIMTGAADPKIPKSYVEDQVRSSFKASKFDAKVEDPRIENNLFHPDRKMLKRVALSSVHQPRMILYGTFITQDLQMAYLEDLESPHISNSGVRRQQALMKGDAISGFVLQDIRQDKVLLVRDQEKIWIRIDEKKPPRGNDVTGQELPLSGKNKPQSSK